MKTKDVLLVPFNDMGDQLSYEQWKCTWKENYEFTAIIEYIGHTRGRSATQLVWMDQTGKKYVSTLKFFDDLFVAGKFNAHATHLGRRLRIHGTFTFRKMGQNYFITGTELPKTKR